MAFSRRLDLLDFDVAPDEELPDYQPQGAPDYNSEDHETPLLTYHLRQAGRKLQIFVPCGPRGPSCSSSYKIYHKSFGLFSKKPDMEIKRVSHERILEDSIACAWFDNDGPFPWRPRAHISHTDSHGRSTHAMESSNFSDWTITIGGTTYTWTLEDKPVSLVLCEKTASHVMARFTYSECGTLATKGAEVGELAVYRSGMSSDSDGMEKMMCGLMVAIVHFQKMGRNYWNEGSARAASLTREH